MQKRWKLLEAEQAKIASLQNALKINGIICKILVQRGFDTFEKAKDFFRPQLTRLHDPWLMKDMTKAVDRILTAIQSGEKILVYGDYDVDGTNRSRKHVSSFSVTFIQMWISIFRTGTKKGMEFRKLGLIMPKKMVFR